MSDRKFRNPVTIPVRTEASHWEMAKEIGIEATDIFNRALEEELGLRNSIKTQLTIAKLKALINDEYEEISRHQNLVESYQKAITRKEKVQAEMDKIRPHPATPIIPESRESQYIQEIRADRKRRGIE